MTAHVFVTGTGTEIGKTWVSRGIAAAARKRGLRVVALKPYETGCQPEARDAIALARAAGDESLADPDGLYRASPALAPWAATLAGEPPPPGIDALATTLRARSRDADLVLVEGAGGLLVPVDEEHDVADLAKALSMPILLVARNGLGVLSHTLTAFEAARSRDLDVVAIVLTPSGAPDVSTHHNRRILDVRLPSPVLEITRCEDDDATLAAAAEASNLLDLIRGRSSSISSVRKAAGQIDEIDEERP
jgi:dethiobiotin synthetase